MKTPPPWQAQLKLAERLVASILQMVFRFNSNARLGSRNELHTHLLLLNGVARSQRRDAPRGIQGNNFQRHHAKQTHMKSDSQNDLIVSGKTEKEKRPLVFEDNATSRFTNGAKF